MFSFTLAFFYHAFHFLVVKSGCREYNEVHVWVTSLRMSDVMLATKKCGEILVDDSDIVCNGLVRSSHYLTLRLVSVWTNC
jgi:hypothetical protein